MMVRNNLKNFLIPWSKTLATVLTVGFLDINKYGAILWSKHLDQILKGTVFMPKPSTKVFNFNGSEKMGFG